MEFAVLLDLLSWALCLVCLSHLFFVDGLESLSDQSHEEDN